MEGIFRKKGGARKLLTKEKRGLFLDLNNFFRENMKDFYHAHYVFFLWGIRRAHVTDYVIGFSQEIPD